MPDYRTLVEVLAEAHNGDEIIFTPNGICRGGRQSGRTVQMLQQVVDEAWRVSPGNFKQFFVLAHDLQTARHMCAELQRLCSERFEDEDWEQLSTTCIRIGNAIVQCDSIHTDRVIRFYSKVFVDHAVEELLAVDEDNFWAAHLRSKLITSHNFQIGAKEVWQDDRWRLG